MKTFCLLLLIGLVCWPTALWAQAKPSADDVGVDDAFDVDRAVIDWAHQQLSEQLSAEGRLSTKEHVDATSSLTDLAAHCQIFAASASSEQARLELLTCRARALSALAWLASQQGDIEKAAVAGDSLREVIGQMRSTQAEHARVVSDYWQLLLDIAEVSDSPASVEVTQGLVEQLLSAYIDQYASNDNAQEWVADVRLSLAQLMDERGDQRGAVQQLDAMGALPDGGPRQQAAALLRARAGRIGMPVTFEAVSTGLVLWRVADHAGAPVLIHVYADTVLPSVAIVKDIRQAIDRGALGGVSIVSLRIGEPAPDVAAPPWPVLPVQLTPGGVLDRLGIEALPALVWLDRQGKLASIGHHIAVIDQLPEPAQEPVEVEAEID